MYIWSIDKLKFRYVYQYLDHLGNVRLSYSDLDKSGDIDKETEIIEENNYYPFGLKHRGYNEIVNSETEHKFRFNDTEFDADFDLNWYNMPLRHQDPTTGRWNGIDPVTHFSSSTYAGYNNNPVFWADPSGACGTSWLSKAFCTVKTGIGVALGKPGVKLGLNVATNLGVNAVNGGGGKIELGGLNLGKLMNDFKFKGNTISGELELTLSLVYELESITGLILNLSETGALTYKKEETNSRNLGGAIFIGGSETARNDLIKIIDNSGTVMVYGSNGYTGVTPDTNNVQFNFMQILNYKSSGSLDVETMGFGMTFLHELLHTLKGGSLTDIKSRTDFNTKGETVKRVNIYRQELDDIYQSGSGSGFYSSEFLKTYNNVDGYYGQRMHYVAPHDGKTARIKFLLPNGTKEKISFPK